MQGDHHRGRDQPLQNAGCYKTCMYQFVEAGPQSTSTDMVAQIGDSKHCSEEESTPRTAKRILNACLSKVISYLGSIDVVMYVADPLDAVENHMVAFQPFFWQASEDADTPRAIAHLQQELQKFGVAFGPIKCTMCTAST
eukprot:gene42523-56519_t